MRFDSPPRSESNDSMEIKSEQEETEEQKQKREEEEFVLDSHRS